MDPYRLTGQPEVIEEALFRGCGSLTPQPCARCVAFNRRGTLLAAGSDRGLVLLWDLQTRGLAATLCGGHKDTVTAVSWAKDGRRCGNWVWAQGGRLQRAHRRENPSLPPLRPQRRPPHPPPPFSLLRLLTSSKDGTLVLWDVFAEAPLLRLKLATAAAEALGQVEGGWASGHVSVHTHVLL